MKVPFVDLREQYLSLKSEMDAAIHKVIDETAFISGSYAKKFETDFSAFMGVKHTIACANGTDSLEILLKAMNIGAGNEVIVPAVSWISTSEAVSAVGATPVFVDVNDDLLIDVSKIEAAINANTKAIIPVHLYGNPADMPAIMAIAKKHNLRVMEDCAQSHGAKINGKNVSTFGDCASHSFYPGKNLGAYGDSGGMTTDDDQIARVARAIANHGQEGKHNHIMEGRNSRMDGIQAAVLSVKIPYLDQWTEARIAHALKYNELINDRVRKPIIRDHTRHVFHLYVIRVNNRAAFMQKMTEAGVEVAIHYPVALPLMPCYAHRGFTAADFPVAARATQEIVSLPMFAELTSEQLEFVVQMVNDHAE